MSTLHLNESFLKQLAEDHLEINLLLDVLHPLQIQIWVTVHQNHIILHQVFNTRKGESQECLISSAKTYIHAYICLMYYQACHMDICKENSSCSFCHQHGLVHGHMQQYSRPSFTWLSRSTSSLFTRSASWSHAGWFAVTGKLGCAPPGCSTTSYATWPESWSWAGWSPETRGPSCATTLLPD